MLSARKSRDELEALYGDHYVAKYRANPYERLTRLLPLLVLKPTDTVVDFGCGNGMLFDLIGNRVARYIGVDFSESFIRDARQRIEGRAASQAEFVCSTIDAFCERQQNTIDVAFAMDFSEHVYDEEWLQILTCIRSVLKPHGRLYLHTPNAKFIVEVLKAKNFVLAQQPEHIAVRTPEENCQLLEKAGFRIATLRVLAHYKPVLGATHALTILPGIGRYFGARLFIEARPARAAMATAMSHAGEPLVFGTSAAPAG